MSRHPPPRQSEQASRGGAVAAVTPTARHLARQMLLYRAEGRDEPEALAKAAERACARLRDRLASLIGRNGVNALSSRALRLAQTEIPALEQVTFDAQADSGLRGVRAFADTGGRDLAAVAADLAAILAHLIGLLATFIGEVLAIRLVREAWPELPDETVSSEEHP